MNPDITTEDRFRRLFDRIEDAVVEFLVDDGVPVIADVNRTFTEVFGYEADEIEGRPLNDFIVPITERHEAEEFDQRATGGLSTVGFVRGLTVDGSRTFIYQGASTTGDHGFAFYTEVSDELRRKRHIDVLHRILRHNLRNEVNVVLGKAESIIAKTDEPELQRDAAVAKEAATKLARLSDEAKTVENVLGSPPELEAVDVVPIVDEVVADCKRQFDDPEIVVDLPSSLVVRADSRLEAVFESLLDNAVRYNSQPAHVRIDATPVDRSTIELAVADNGPGIPEAETEIITTAEPISQLKHGSGLGLWLVKWIVEMYDGELAIETPDSGGTVVRVRLTYHACEEAT
ncbi:PAS domain-containing sensor histidine kinase [Halohasta salina]|uniref:PAS domain-containing sensor histidine kinase n=1 Tax=Halohasta salina TaxID=2961621 RepID=UPI0020A2630D|nr:PAS domain-containing sensor histidine kinase [Halohasta salina]